MIGHGGEEVIDGVRDADDLRPVIHLMANPLHLVM
jgi:hypothetical protein